MENTIKQRKIGKVKIDKGIDRKTMSKILITLRKILNMSQMEISRELGIKLYSYRKMETTASAITMRVVYKMLVMIHKEYDELPVNLNIFINENIYNDYIKKANQLTGKKL